VDRGRGRRIKQQPTHRADHHRAEQGIASPCGEAVMTIEGTTDGDVAYAEPVLGPTLSGAMRRSCIT
jgi:hypothetical protein